MERRLKAIKAESSPPPGIAAPSEKTAAQAEMFGNRLKKRRRFLSKWAFRAGVEAYRLYDRDIPEIPLVLDWYGPPENGPALAGALYKRPYEKEEAEERLWLGAMKAAASRALDIPPDRIFLKEREHRRGGLPCGGQEDRRFLMDINEGKLRFRVNLSDYLDTGLFPDRRKMRALAGEEAPGKRVLNLFCYTASFSVCAAAGGAAELDSVDMSNTYLAWGLENFRLNGLAAEKVSAETLLARPESRGLPPFRFIRADVLSFLEKALKAKRRWDLVILDPPGFSNSKKMRGDFDLKRDHPALLEKCAKLLEPGGTLYLSASVKGFRLDGEAFTRPAGALRIEDITEKLRDPDFRDRRIPSAYRIRRVT
ncbi:MAG: class I SAM-dependent methyltransferase [Treponema sp.]|jgi:23S rRNA G2069 N7-methylase RlmK/C1962 C5-methylase RlmI|nr:class I SAM-dependent methyltransferase [Treponema sp.]